MKNRFHFSKEELERTVLICRACHNGIHHFYDEHTLAESLNTIEKLCSDEKLAKHFAWVSKTKKGRV